MTEHELKLHEKYFDAVRNGIKTFEVRRFDRDFKVGDTLTLMRVTEKGDLQDYKKIKVAVTYILAHEDFPDGIQEGYCVMGIKLREVWND